MDILKKLFVFTPSSKPEKFELSGEEKTDFDVRDEKEIEKYKYIIMLDLKKKGKTMVFVTHSLDTVENLCNRAVWLHNGKIKIDGEPKTVISEYLKETT